MTNIVGPHGTGINETTTRPTDTASGNPLDTWFQPCVNGDPNTGTKIPAVWLNKVSALFRRAIRGMSVPEDELDDDMLLKAIKQAMPLLVNGTTKLGEITIDHTTNGTLTPANQGTTELTVNVNVAPLTTSPVLRAGFAMVTINARAFLEDASEYSGNAWLRCIVQNAGRAIIVASNEADAYDGGGSDPDLNESGSDAHSNLTILVPLVNGAGTFTMQIERTIEVGAFATWRAHMHAYLDAVFPRAS